MGGIGDTDNMCRIGDKPLQRINLIGDVTNEIKNTYNKTNNWYKEVKEVEKLGWDDGEKHKYMSCRTGQQGNDMSTIGLAAGLTKEAKDLTYKSLSPTQRKRYGGLDGVWEDSKKETLNLFWFVSDKDSVCNLVFLIAEAFGALAKLRFSALLSLLT